MKAKTKTVAEVFIGLAQCPDPQASTYGRLMVASSPIFDDYNEAVAVGHRRKATEILHGIAHASASLYAAALTFAEDVRKDSAVRRTFDEQLKDMQAQFEEKKP